jgi:myo-inositol-1(or 4)-monophosphatase
MLASTSHLRSAQQYRSTLPITVSPLLATDESVLARIDRAEAIVREAGTLALDFFHRQAELTIERKGLQDTVSQADRAVEDCIAQRLAECFPDDAFLGEESGNSRVREADGFTWVVDPIDGTDCFINGIRAWCVSIALVSEGEIRGGVIYDPNAQELYKAIIGHGASLNGKPIRASTADDLTLGIVGIGFSHRVEPAPTLEVLGRLLDAGGMYQRNGSGALMLAYVAAGRYLGYYEAHINSWDALAGVALVREAGGWTNDFLADDGLQTGSVVLASAPGVATSLRSVCGL